MRDIHRNRWTTSNAEIARNPYAPKGFRRRRGICCVGAPPSITMDVPHRLRRAALHLPLRRSERGLLYFNHGLIGAGMPFSLSGYFEGG